LLLSPVLHSLPHPLLSHLQAYCWIRIDLLLPPSYPTLPFCFLIIRALLFSFPRLDASVLGHKSVLEHPCPSVHGSTEFSGTKIVHRTKYAYGTNVHRIANVHRTNVHRTKNVHKSSPVPRQILSVSLQPRHQPTESGLNGVSPRSTLRILKPDG
jgi:hypothetical protein